MPAPKSVKQTHSASPEVLSLPDDFRLMANGCIREGLANESAALILFEEYPALHDSKFGTLGSNPLCKAENRAYALTVIRCKPTRR